MGAPEYIVYVVDDDVRMREAVGELFASLDVASVTFASVAEYVAYTKPELPACLILDVKLPDINGLDFQQQLGDAYHPPIVFITGHGDIPSSVRAMKAGAVDFLEKPFSDQALFDAVGRALEQSERIHGVEAVAAQAVGRAGVIGCPSRRRSAIRAPTPTGQSVPGAIIPSTSSAEATRSTPGSSSVESRQRRSA